MVLKEIQHHARKHQQKRRECRVRTHTHLLTHPLATSPNLIRPCFRAAVSHPFSLDCSFPVLSLRSEHDLVPLVDYQGGLVQNIRCRYGSARNCHSLKTVACELRNGCQLFNRTFSQCDDWTANPQLAVVYGGATSAGVRAETLSLGVVALLCLAVLYLHV